MTAAAVSSAPASSPADGPLGPRLVKVHREWLGELRAQVEKAEAKDRHMWVRWEVIRYVDTVLSARFDRERRVVGEIAEGPALWVASELVSSLRWQLRSSVGLCHREAEFSILMGKLVRAVEHWFATVEDVVGPTRWADLTPEAQREFGSLGIEAPSAGQPSAALVTSS
jgi:hypothetical protein